MKQVVQNYKTGDLTVVDVPTPTLNPQGVLVQNHFSLISVGTEGMKVEQAEMNLIEKAKARPDQVKQVIDSIKNQGLIDTYQKVMDRLDSLTPLGYSSAGIVKGVGKNVSHLEIGERVACAGAGYANHAEFVYVPKNLVVKVPDNVSLEEASFTTAGAIALQGVRQAETVIGENVAVIGLGLIGLITIKILNAAGCNTLGIDIEKSQVEWGKKVGCDLSLLREHIEDKKSITSFTNGKGIDSVIITAATQSNDPINLASNLCRDRGKIIVVGSINIEIPNTLKSNFYEKELDLRMSRSYGPGRYDRDYEEKGIDYPLGYVRWTEGRNMEAFLRLIASKSIQVGDLVSRRFSINQAEEAYELISNESSQGIVGIVFDYDKESKVNNKVKLRKRVQKNDNIEGNVGIGLIGVGSHTRSKLIPSIVNNDSVDLIGVCSATGLTSKDIGEKYNFRYCTSEYKTLLADPDIDVVFISTRHNLHELIVTEALKHQKRIFVEKPLAITFEGLKKVIETYNSYPSVLFVGFNRRYASHSQKLKSFFDGYNGPKILNYRVNAGYQSPDNWYQDPDEGGGRLAGEGGHFIDLMSYITGAKPTRIYASSAPDRHLPIPDNNNLIIDFDDGSVGSIVYTSGGDKSFPKERLEVFGGGRIGVLDDFHCLTLIINRRKKVHRNWLGQDKGHKNEVEVFINSIMGNNSWPVSFNKNVITTYTTLLAVESIKQNKPFNIDIDEISCFID